MDVDKNSKQSRYCSAFGHLSAKIAKTALQSRSASLTSLGTGIFRAQTMYQRVTAARNCDRICCRQRPEHISQSENALTTSHGWAISFFFCKDRKLVQASQPARSAVSAMEENIFDRLTKQIDRRVKWPMCCSHIGLR